MHITKKSRPEPLQTGSEFVPSHQPAQRHHSRTSQHARRHYYRITKGGSREGIKHQHTHYPTICHKQHMNCKTVTDR